MPADAVPIEEDEPLRGRARALLLGRGIASVATLPALLDDVELVRPGEAPPDVVLAWGRRPSAERADGWARRNGLPLCRIEDGFLRSLGGGDQDAPLSIVVDDSGIYYDAASPSRLERLILAPRSAAALARASRFVDRWRTARVSKYNGAREAPEALGEGDVLVVDQTFGDASIRHGGADIGSFHRMLEAALDEHPASGIVLKVHPDVIAGRKRGHFGRMTAGASARVRLLAANAHPPGLLERAAAVYAVTSQFGFEALLWRVPARIFGMPFYAGWGLTNDESRPPARRGPASIDALADAALIRYPRYIDPETGRRCEAERLLEWMALQRVQRERFPAVVQVLGFSRWKKPIARAFLAGSQVRFARRAETVPRGATVALWGRKSTSGLPDGARVLRIEDGFLRSVGLGADLVRPVSWVVDPDGLYYDAGVESGLERLLATTAFDAALRARAVALRERILALGVTKYNVGSMSWHRPRGRRVVLAVGQVESDAAIALGAAETRTNLDLLRAVRRRCPHDYLVYKPHPDVVARLRRAGKDEHAAARHCDEVVIDVPIDAMLRAVDEVHVMTSLAGFEALLRGRRVVCHGWPFYAGWGLTDDVYPHPRRHRRLGLDELVAATLILYPTYVSRTTGRFTTAERALEELAAWRQIDGPTRASASRRLWRALLRIGRTVSGGPA